MAGIWLYSIAKKAERIFKIEDKKTIPVSIDSYEKLIQSKRFREDEWWYIMQNWKKIGIGDEVFIYTGDEDKGIIGYATIRDVKQLNGVWHINLEFDFEKCQQLLEKPIPASIVRQWIHYPRRNVADLSRFATELYRLLPFSTKRAILTENDIPTKIGTGAGFGEANENLQVEKAAIAFVTQQYNKRGWSVQSVEGEKRGFDLICRKGKKEEHVEVKGISGNTCIFIVTVGEVKQAESNPNFVLWAVTEALSKTPKSSRFTGKEFLQKFSLEPLQYRAALK